MHSPAAAFAWELGRRHRWGLAAVASYLALLAAGRLWLVASGRVFVVEHGVPFALAVIVPFATAFMYFLAAFSFGFAGDLAGRDSIYPARLFTLPVTSAALAGWPMLYGSAAAALLWLATRSLALWPPEIALPWLWPALFGAVILAWVQALTWMPYAFAGMRVIATVLLMVSIDGVVFTALQLEASEPAMLALLAPLLPLAFFVARFAVSRARRGDVPDWRSPFVRPARRSSGLPRGLDRFRSPASAQLWFEWRRHGRSLPTMVAILLPFELALLFAFRETPALVSETLLAIALTPAFLATFVAATVGRAGVRDAYGVTPFLAARPLAGGALVGAKLKAALWSTLAAWLLLLVTVPLAVWLSGTGPVVADGARRLAEILGASRALVTGSLWLVAFVASTWTQLVASLAIGMSGRAWMVKGSVFVALVLVAVLVPLAYRVAGSRAAIAWLWNAFPWILALLVGLKVVAAAGIAWRLDAARLLAARTLLLGAAAWSAAVLALWGLLVWLLPTMVFPRYLLAFVAILAIPLTRLAAAPLALAWNRHR